MEKFRGVVDSCGFRDLGFVGFHIAEKECRGPCGWRSTGSFFGR